MMETLKVEVASTACPDCGKHDAAYDTVHIGIPKMCPVSGTITQRYYCSSCHFVAFGADAWRANGIATDAQVPTSWRQSAHRYTMKMRSIT